MEIPTDQEIRELHERLAPSPEAFERVYTHCRIVCELAEQIIDRHSLAVDVALVRAGCLLHDIGVYRLSGPPGEREHYIRHGVLGAGILDDLGFPEPIRRFCSCHTGVGLTRDDILRQGLPIPVADYVPETDEEELVMYADKFHSKSRPPVFVGAAHYAVAVRRFGDDKVATFQGLVDKYGEPDLASLATAYGHAIV
jgi:uncharacterized protein